MGIIEITKTIARAGLALALLGALAAVPARAQESSKDVATFSGILFKGSETEGDLAMDFSGPKAPEASNLKLVPGSTLKVYLPVARSLKSARFSLFRDGDPGPGATLELRVNGQTISSELPTEFDPIDLGDHLVPGDNVIELSVSHQGEPVDLQGVRIDKVMAPAEDEEEGE